MATTGGFRARVQSAWTEIRENPGRSILQALGVMLGVASVLGGFSISDSQRKRADELFVKMGGLDKMNVQPAAIVKDGGTPSALETANLGLRAEDASEGEGLEDSAVHGCQVKKFARTRVRSAWADQERAVRGIGFDFLPLAGFEIAKGRAFPQQDMDSAAPVAT